MGTRSQQRRSRATEYLGNNPKILEDLSYSELAAPGELQ